MGRTYPGNAQLPRPCSPGRSRQLQICFLCQVLPCSSPAEKKARFDHLWSCLIMFDHVWSSMVVEWEFHWVGLRENFNRKPMGFYHQIVWAFRCKFCHHPILWELEAIGRLDSEKTMVILPSGALIWANKSRILKWKRWYFCGHCPEHHLRWGYCEVATLYPKIEFQGIQRHVYIYIERERERLPKCIRFQPPFVLSWGVDNGQCLPFSKPYGRIVWGMTTMKSLLPHSLW